MRKITEKAVNVFLDSSASTMKMGNTEVTTDGSVKCMYLHGSCIAINKRGEISLNNHGYETNTTKERLNGILSELGKDKIVQKKGVWYLGKEEFPHNQYVNISRA